MFKSQCKMLVTVLAGGLFLGGCASSDKDMASTMGPNLSAGDSQFFNTMAIGNMTEISLSQVAVAHSGNNAVKDFAQRMIDDHTAAQQKLAALADEKQVMLPTKLDDKHQAMVDTLRTKTGKEFDQQFVDDQVEAHNAAVAADESEANNGSDAKTKALANEMLDTLKMHLSMAQKMQNAM